MSKIHQLPPHIVAKIAAGEVIERPAFAVKELVENAIDAGATSIKIYLEEAGLKKIQVTDNGEGMVREDLIECWKPHTTSKITEQDTLIGIKSFGFRGEALASLAAVSTLIVKSRTHQNPTGNEICIKDGKLLSEKPIGMPQGTIVTVENLFQHFPARRKFMKSQQTELRHVVDSVNRLAAANTSIQFVLQHGKKILIDFPITKTITERIKSIVGESAFSQFLPVKRNDNYIKISGFIAKPQLNSSTQNKQFLFINRRYVTDKLISLAVKDAFGTMLEPTSYPIFVLALEVPFEMVDINVHPRKEQVSFMNAQFVFQTIQQTVQEVLQEHNLTFQNLSWKRKGVGMTNSFAGKMLKEEILSKDQLIIEKKSPVTQLHNLYIVTQIKDGFLFVDQHGAHERILFEKFKKEFLRKRNNGGLYQLTEPFKLALSPSEQLLLKDYKKNLEIIGFRFHKISITALPILFQDRNPQDLIIQLLEELELRKQLKDIDTVSEEMIAFLACRSAVKAGDHLETIQMRTLIDDLQKTPNNSTCPHGRPTQITFAKEYIDRLFKR